MDGDTAIDSDLQPEGVHADDAPGGVGLDCVGTGMDGGAAADSYAQFEGVHGDNLDGKANIAARYGA